MFEILIGFISGIVSRNGNGRRNNIDSSPFYLYEPRPTCGSSNKFNIFYSNINSCNNCKYKTWKMRYWMDNRFNYSCEIVLFDYSYASSFTLQTNLSKDKNALYKEIRESILERMVYLKIKAKDATNKEIRIMEER